MPTKKKRAAARTTRVSAGRRADTKDAKRSPDVKGDAARKNLGTLVDLVAEHLSPADAQRARGALLGLLSWGEEVPSGSVWNGWGQVDTFDLGERMGCGRRTAQRGLEALAEAAAKGPWGKDMSYGWRGTLVSWIVRLTADFRALS